MAKRSGMFKFEKRKKELARQKKQEEKRLRRQNKQEGGEGPPVVDLEEIDAAGLEADEDSENGSDEELSEES